MALRREEISRCTWPAPPRCAALISIAAFEILIGAAIVALIVDAHAVANSAHLAAADAVRRWEP